MPFHDRSSTCSVVLLVIALITVEQPLASEFHAKSSSTKCSCLSTVAKPDELENDADLDIFTGDMSEAVFPVASRTHTKANSETLN